jgi:hypothetical protein
MFHRPATAPRRLSISYHCLIESVALRKALPWACTNGTKTPSSKAIQSGTTDQGICLYSNDTAPGHWSLKARRVCQGSAASRSWRWQYLHSHLDSRHILSQLRLTETQGSYVTSSKVTKESKENENSNPGLWNYKARVHFSHHRAAVKWVPGFP